ncbi:protein ABHD15-like [Anneissia japonica]|uniref:protein ABHD15-like n=1 Tax=Anneissia japonica TaxID=1529436 RepID=UPI0014256C63|nr:protein ABHD15-like [Anneissia japonica]XP_033123308.1 protein ABHD15-like [Anneissia japonica]XP_033123310.1 protein ABHD15-like [Anneissia japonica]XP_033123311.1 protein ABHD15-like [Anneissia japonica]
MVDIITSMPALFYKESSLMKFVLRKCSILKSPYKPTLWSINGHIQTILTVLWPIQRDLKCKRQYLQVDDGGLVALDWVLPSCCKTSEKINMKSPLVIVIPGLPSNTFVVNDICDMARNCGYRVVIFRKRGQDGLPLTTPKLQSIGDCTDLRETVRFIREQYPKAKLNAVAYGYGTGLLMSYLGEFGSSADLSAAVNISPSYNMQQQFDDVFRNPYNWFMLQYAKLQLSYHAGALLKTLDCDSAFSSSSLSEFEQNVYAKMYGIQDMEEYWDKNNPLREVDEIAVPLLCINSLDDPICHASKIPYDLFTMIPNAILVTTTHGGHCGFFQHLKPDSWANRLAIQYLDSVLQFVHLEDGFKRNSRL